MALADWILQHLGATGNPKHALLAEAFLDLMHPDSSVGGLEGLLGVLGANGMGKEAQSWVGKGANQDVSAEQIKALFADPRVAEAMKASGSPVTPDQAAALLATWLPYATDAVTPEGKVPAAQALEKLIAQLKQSPQAPKPSS